ncbi:MAG: hypothetical protein ACRYG4_11015, partial [Janthinobacterium lividum]
MTNPAPSSSPFTRTFNPVFTRKRHDGWTQQKQVGFINALAETACVTDACRAVGMSTESAYALRRRYDAIDFRMTWDLALEYAVHRVADAALSRAIHGVAVPHYYKGEVVGEHRRYNETLTMFILRYRDPYTYARCRDRQDVRSLHPEERSESLAVGIDCILGDESRKYCEANHREQQAAADKEDDLKILEARREAAYQEYIRAEDAAKAAAKAAAAVADAAMAAAARAARAAPDPADKHRAASLAGGGSVNAPELASGGTVDAPELAAEDTIEAAAAEIVGGIAAIAIDGSGAIDAEDLPEPGQPGDTADVEDAADGLAGAEATDATDFADTSGTAAEAPDTRGEAAFHPDVASGSSTSGDRPEPMASAPAPNAGKWDPAALAAAGYHVVHTAA